MIPEYEVNGVRLDAGSARPAVVFAEMREQGWRIREVAMDGREVDQDTESSWPTEVRRVEIRAELPGKTTSGPVDREGLREQLRSALPALGTEAREIGLAFSRGEWRSTLQTLDRFLADLQVVEAGFRAVADLEPGIVERLGPLSGYLRELGNAVGRRSWVEVSDTLLYEVGPYFEEWVPTSTC